MAHVTLPSKHLSELVELLSFAPEDEIYVRDADAPIGEPQGKRALISTLSAYLAISAGGAPAISYANSMSGTGTTQAGATLLTAHRSRATTVTPTNNAFLAEEAAATTKDEFWFFNDDSTDSAKLFPFVGDDLGNGINNAVTIAAGDWVHYILKPGDTWALQDGTVT